MMRKIGWVALVVVAGCGVIPGTACTEIGCTSGLSVDVSDPAGLDRDIDVTAEIDGQVLQCSGTVDAVDGLFCDGIEIVPSADGYVLVLSADIEAPAEDVHLTIAWDGAVAFDDDLAPTWGEPSSPNGEHCEPTCIQGDAAIAL